MSLLDSFWDKNDAQTIRKIFKECGVELKFDLNEYRSVFVSIEDIFRLLLNRINEQTFFLEFIINENNLKL